MKMAPSKTAVIACAVLEIEITHFACGLSHIIRVDMLEQGLHDDPPKLREKLQAAVNGVEAETDAEAIVLGYGLCSRGDPPPGDYRGNP